MVVTIAFSEPVRRHGPNKAARSHRLWDQVRSSGDELSDKTAVLTRRLILKRADELPASLFPFMAIGTILLGGVTMLTRQQLEQFVKGAISSLKRRKHEQAAFAVAALCFSGGFAIGRGLIPDFKEGFRLQPKHRGGSLT
jgi:hypothetical protein